MKTHPSLPLFYVLPLATFLLHLQITTTAVAATPLTATTNFILTSCQSTQYPDLCFTSLSHYASHIQHDPARLARVAIGISLSRTKRLANYVSNLSHQADIGAEPRAVSALHDCFSVFGDAVDNIRDSLRQIRRLGGAGESVRFELSNVQTYMSAALTNEDTCTDGFEDVEDGPMKRDVCNRSVMVKQMTSNALALVNNFVAKLTAP